MPSVFGERKVRVEFGSDKEALLKHSTHWGGWVAVGDAAGFEEYEWFSLAWTMGEVMNAKVGNCRVLPWGELKLAA